MAKEGSRSSFNHSPFGGNRKALSMVSRALSPKCALISAKLKGLLRMADASARAASPARFSAGPNATVEGSSSLAPSVSARYLSALSALCTARSKTPLSVLQRRQLSRLLRAHWRPYPYPSNCLGLRQAARQAQRAWAARPAQSARPVVSEGMQLQDCSFSVLPNQISFATEAPSLDLLRLTRLLGTCCAVDYRSERFCFSRGGRLEARTMRAVQPLVPREARKGALLGMRATLVVGMR